MILHQYVVILQEVRNNLRVVRLYTPIHYRFIVVAYSGDKLLFSCESVFLNNGPKLFAAGLDNHFYHVVCAQTIGELYDSIS